MSAKENEFDLWLEKNIKNKLPDFYFDDDTIFHYTSAEKAEKIINSKVLRASPRKSSNDPIENINEITDSFTPIDQNGPSILFDEEVKNNAKFIEEQIKTMLHKAKQLSFCCNDIENKSLGFLKPRMWDQYGDKYNGVCLVFSKTSLMAENDHLLNDSNTKNVNYLFYSNLDNFNFAINWNKLSKDREICIDQYMTKINEKLYAKHTDYSGENELRVVTFSEYDFDELKIEKSLKGIIISRNASFCYRKYFKEYSEENKIDCRFIKWYSNNVKILRQDQYDYKDFFERNNLT